MYQPFNYSELNKFAGTYSPSTVKNRTNKSFDYHVRALYQRAISAIDIEWPEIWMPNNAIDLATYMLFRIGFFAILDTDKYGLIAQPCTLSGIGINYQPTTAIVANPLLTEINTLAIGEQCEVIKLSPDYCGAWDIIEYYAEQLSLLDNAVNISLINSKFSYLLGAKNKAAAEALKKVLDLVNKGDPAVVYNQRILDDPASKSSPLQFLDFGSPKDRYIVSEMLQDRQNLINAFDREIGIPTLPYSKKERLVTSEADSAIVDSTARVSVWVDELNHTFELANKHYDLNLRASIKNEGGAEDNGEDNTNRDVQLSE